MGLITVTVSNLHTRYAYCDPFWLCVLKNKYVVHYFTVSCITLQNVTNGPYLCPKHTRCHSCGSGVPGSGHSTRYLSKRMRLIKFTSDLLSMSLLPDVPCFSITFWIWVPRWFLGYTCCDACGRLFVKGNYCPVCLKVAPLLLLFLGDTLGFIMLCSISGC